ncbi:MAG: DUF3656 domain-containing protein [Eubacterium sp.]|nr:DUF3656 domain-containing protein [Eubacterium sp.]
MMSAVLPRHMGRQIGRVEKTLKGKVTLTLNAPVAAKDILILPGKGEKEIVLTVPGDRDPYSRTAISDKPYQLTLNAPSTKSIRPGDPVYRRHNEKLNRWIHEEILDRKILYPVRGSLKVSKDNPVTLHLTSRDSSVSVTGPVPSQAQNRPICREDILRQMRKTGNVPYELEDLQISMDPDLFLPASAIKDLRQKAYRELTDSRCRTYYRKEPVRKEKPVNLEKSLYRSEYICQENPAAGGEKKGRPDTERLAAICQEDLLTYCLAKPVFDGYVLPMDFFDKDRLIKLKALIHKSDRKVYLSLPRVFRQTTEKCIRNYLEETLSDGILWDGVYLHNINEIGILPDSMAGLPTIISSSFYQWNSESLEETLRLNGRSLSGQAILDLPLELSGKECLDLMSNNPGIQGECLVYGRFPVMLSAQCVKKTLGRCNGREEIYELEDQQGRRLPMSSHCHPDWVDQAVGWYPDGNLACYNMIWADRPRDLIGKEFHPLSKYISRFRFDFFSSSIKEIDDVISRYKTWEKDLFKESEKRMNPHASWEQGIE